MSITFTKLFTSITESTIWVAPDAHRLCWITMLAMADHRGRVWGSVPGLANRARIDVEAARSAIKSFLSPDPDSRTQDHEGRRIAEIDGGWVLLNHAKYRAIRDDESVRESKRKYINSRRERERVENVDKSRSQSSQAEAEAEAEADTKEKAETRSRSSRLLLKALPADWLIYCANTRPDLDPATVWENFRDYWIAKPGKDGCKLDWLATWRSWVRKERAQVGGSPSPATRKCAECSGPMKGGSTRAPKGMVCNSCWKKYMEVR